MLTSIAGTERISGLRKDREPKPRHKGLAKALREAPLLVSHPVLLGRLVAIPYYPLSPERLGKLAKLQINRIKKRVEARYKIQFGYSEAKPGSECTF